MKILLLSDANSIHTQKWVDSISLKGFEVQLFSLFKPNKNTSNKYKKTNVIITSLNLKSKIKELREPNISKIKYLKSIPVIKKIIKQFKPDLIHAHYASSYGLLGILSGFKPLITSAWGSDIYHFPNKNIINKWLLRLVIAKSDKICSTSKAMKQVIEKEFNRFDIHEIPFGVDTNIFKPNSKMNEKFIVGTIKSIESHNGIDCLIDAASLVINNFKRNINFMIVGEGSLKKEMHQKAKELKINDKIEFIGYVDHETVLRQYNKLSIFIAVSKRESFGVSVLEAASCEIPSITSDVGGLIEVNLNNKTGIVIKPNEPMALARSIVKIYDDEKFRFRLGKNARKRVIKEYSWEKNVKTMINLYKSFQR